MKTKHYVIYESHSWVPKENSILGNKKLENEKLENENQTLCDI